MYNNPQCHLTHYRYHNFKIRYKEILAIFFFFLLLFILDCYTVQCYSLYSIITIFILIYSVVHFLFNWSLVNV